MAPHTRSRGPAAPAPPLESIPPPSRTPLTIRFKPRISAVNATSPATKDVDVTSLMPTSPLVPLPSAHTRASPPAPTQASPAPTSTPAASVQTPDQPIYTFPPPPPPQTVSPLSPTNIVSPLSPAPTSPPNNVVELPPVNGQLNTSPPVVPASTRTSMTGMRHQYRPLAMAPVDDDSRRVGILTAVSPTPPAPAETMVHHLAQPSLQPTVQPPVQPPAPPPVRPPAQSPVQSHVQHPTQPPVQHPPRALVPPVQPPVQSPTQLHAQPPTQPSHQPPATFPAPSSNTELEYDNYTPDPMDVDEESISANDLTAKHREANRKYRQRLKERRQNGEIDEVEFARRKERQRINSRNSRARRKARRDGTLDEGSMSMSSDAMQLAGPGVGPSTDITPGASDFLPYLPDTNQPSSSTTFHEILTKANGVNTDNVGYHHHVPESISTPFPAAHIPPEHLPPAPPPMPFRVDPFRYAQIPMPRTRYFRDAGVMTDPIPDLTKGIETSFDPIPPSLARHPHKQLTDERLREFHMNPLELINKAFLLIIPDQGGSLGKLIICRVVEHRVSAAGHRFLVQFWGDRTPVEMSVKKMLTVLAGGYEIDPPSDNHESQPSGLTGKLFGALRSFTGF